MKFNFCLPPIALMVFQFFLAVLMFSSSVKHFLVNSFVHIFPGLFEVVTSALFPWKTSDSLVAHLLGGSTLLVPPSILGFGRREKDRLGGCFIYNFHK